MTNTQNTTSYGKRYTLRGRGVSTWMKWCRYFVWGDDWPLIYINEKTQQVYYQRIVRLFHCLFSLRSFVFWGVFSLLFAIHTLVFFLEPTDERWPPLITGSVILIYGWIAWFYTIYRTIYYHLYMPAPQPYYIFIDLAALYFNSLLQNLCFLAAIAEFDKTAFIGMDSDKQSDVRIYWLAFNLSAETIAGLGTGSVYANPDATTLLSFLPIWLNSLQGILFNGLIVGGFVGLITLSIRRHLQYMVVVETKADRPLDPSEVSRLERIRDMQRLRHPTIMDEEGYVNMSQLKSRAAKRDGRLFPPHLST